MTDKDSSNLSKRLESIFDWVTPRFYKDYELLLDTTKKQRYMMRDLLLDALLAEFTLAEIRAILRQRSMSALGETTKRQLGTLLAASLLDQILRREKERLQRPEDERRSLSRTLWFVSRSVGDHYICFKHSGESESKATEVKIDKGTALILMEMCVDVLKS